MVVLGPILAQVAVLSLADRTEARYIVSDDTHAEASTRPLVALDVRWRRSDLRLSYAPAFTILPDPEADPSQSRDPALIIFHSGTISGSHSWGRTKLTLSETGSYGTQNFRSAVLTDQRPINPTPGTGNTTPNSGNSGGTGTPGTGSTAGGTGSTPGGTGSTTGGTGSTTSGGMGSTTGGTNATALRAANVIVHFASSTTSAALEHRTGPITVRGELAYNISGATRPEEQATYPVVRGPRAQVSVTDRLSAADNVTGTVIGQYSSSSTGNSVWIGTLTSSWGHRFDAHTTSQLGAGLSGTRTPLDQGYTAYTIYPVITASLNSSSTLARGILGLGLMLTSSPVVDLTTSVADPRVGVNAIASWQRHRFSTFLGVNAQLSTAAPASAGSLSSVGAAVGMGYGLGKGVALDGGFRIAYQTYEGATVVPLSYAVFIGLAFGAQQRL